MAALYRAHDVYVHAAEWEGFGVPAIEAMSCGLPVVSPRGQGPAEIVPYSDLLADCEPADPDQPESVCPVSVSSLAENMRKAGADRALCRILSRIGRKAAVEHYDADVVATHWLSVLGLSD
jgi:glycosyltransferase involved in cell wall biosynthesis